MIFHARSRLALCGVLAAFGVAAPAAMAGKPERIEVEGACTYAERLAPLIEQQHSFVLCDRFITLRDGDRVEMYRPLQCDPKESRRRRQRLTTRGPKAG